MQPPRFMTGLVWCGVAGAAIGVAAAQDGDVGAVDPREGPRKLEPLAPAPVLLEQVMRDVLEAAPARETLDDVMRRAAARDGAAAAALQRRQFLRQQTMQFEQMLEPLLAVELVFARRACGSLPPVSRREVLAASRRALSDVAERLARLQLDGVGREDERFDTRRVLHEQVAAALAPRAAAAELASYEREWQLRQSRRAEAARVRIVAKLDEQLGLTEAQRRAVLEDLESRWQTDWIRELEDHDGMMINEYPPAPDFAEASIVPHLQADQVEQWRKWRAAAGWHAMPRNAVDWTDLNVLQPQVVQPSDAWWRQ